MLYSKTNGYLKLLKKDGKYLLLKKFDKALKENIWLLKKDDSFEVENRDFTIESFAFSELYYAVGNIESKINKNQRNKQCFAKSRELWFHSVYAQEHIEYYLGRELERVEELFA